MQKHFLNALFSMAFLASCTQANLEALENATVTCKSDADCTEGFYCETRLDPVQCRDVGERDDENPELVSSSITPEAGTVGTELTATFEVNEPVLVDQLNVYFEGGRSFDYVAEASDPEANAFVFKITLAAGDPQGPQRVVKAFLKDVGGSSATVDLATAVNVDFTPPSATGQPNLSSYRVDDEVSYQVTVTEPLQEGTLPILEVRKDGDVADGFFNAGVQNANNPLIYDYTSTTRLAASDSGAYTISISGLEDALGNQPDDTVAGGGFTVDASIPQIIITSEENRRFSNGQTVTLCFNIAEDSPAEGYPKVTLNSNLVTDKDFTADSQACPETTYGFALTLNQAAEAPNTEEAAFVIVEMADAAGNLQSANSTVILDFKPPTVTGTSNLTAYRNGQTVRYTLAFSEPVLGAADLLALTAGTTTLTRTQEESAVFEAPATDFADGVHGIDTNVLTSFTDLAGNGLVMGGFDDVTVDASVPQVTLAVFDRDVHSLQPGFNEVLLSVEMSETLASFTAVLKTEALGDVPLTCGDFTSLTAFTCSHALTAGDVPANTNGTYSLQLEGADGAGNGLFQSEPVRIDNKPPELMAAQVTYEPGPDSVLALVTAAKTGSSALLAFSTDEPATVGEVTATCTGDAVWAQTTANDAQTYFVYRHTVGNENDAADCYVKATLTDAVGNVRAAEEGLALKTNPAGAAGPDNFSPDGLVVIDNTPPVVAEVLEVSGLKHVRMPFGAVQSNYESAQYVAALDANNLAPLDGTALPAGIVAEEVRRVQFFDAPSGGTLQGQSGNLSAAIKLNSTDSPELFAEVVDGAGNLSERVRVVSEYVTRFAEDEDELTENPVDWLGGGPSPSDDENDLLLALGEKDGESPLRFPAYWKEQHGNNPEARSDHSLTYDAARGVVVLFGGYNNEILLSDTWEYDGISWRQITPTDPENDGNPEARSFHSLTYDAARGVVVLFGGDGDNGRLSDTWEYDGTSWKEITPTDPEGDGDPRARWAPSLTYDSARGVVVLFGGREGSGSDGTNFSDTWEYDGASWTEITPTDPENDGNPSGRFFDRLTYDAARGVVVLFGGHEASDPTDPTRISYLSDAWEYDGISWKQITPIDPENDGNPSGRSFHGLTYDAARGVVVLFGGYEAGLFFDPADGFLSDTWEYGGFIGGFALPLSKTNFESVSLHQLVSVMVAKQNDTEISHLQIQSNSPMQTTMAPNQFARETDGQWETITHTITEPAQLQQLATGDNQTITAQFKSEKLDPNAPKQPINLDYMELRFLYDLDHDNTQFEPTCGDGVIQSGLGEACDDGNTQDGDYCAADCTQELAWCGDGAIQANAGEVCDGESDTHWCSSDCWFRLAKDAAEPADGGL